MSTEAAIEIFSIIDDLGTTSWRTRRDRVHQAMQARGYTATEIHAAETKLTGRGTIEQRDEYLEWARPTF